MIIPFELPDELKGLTTKQIISDMLEGIDYPVDKTEGGFVYDMVAPSGIEAAELIQFYLVLALKNSFHMWAKGRWLDYCAADCGLTRRSATFAYGSLTVKLSEGVTFPEGFIFSVPSQNGEPAIDFATQSRQVFTKKGSYTFRVKAVLSGPESNVKADAIAIMKNPVRGVEDVTNKEAISGGTLAEDDESLRQRIDDYYAGRMASFVGNKADYVRWAKEIDGVGYAHCIPTYAGAGTVKVVVADLNGDPANEEILNEVELHIFGVGHNDINRLAPIGIVKYEVAAPEPVKVHYTFEVKLEEGYVWKEVTQTLEKNLLELYKSMPDDSFAYGTLRYVAVSKTIFDTEGIADFRHLRLNGQVANVEFGEDRIPVTGSILVTQYRE